MFNKIKLVLASLCILVLINVSAENPASENYVLQQSNLLSGNNSQTSTNYILQSSSIEIVSCDEAVSDNYKILPGYYHGEILGGILAPENVTIYVDGLNVILSWDPVPNATYKVYSSDDPITGFVEDTSGTCVDEIWTAPLPTVKKFYYIKALD